MLDEDEFLDGHGVADGLKNPGAGGCESASPFLRDTLDFRGISRPEQESKRDCDLNREQDRVASFYFSPEVDFSLREESLRKRHPRNSYPIVLLASPLTLWQVCCSCYYDGNQVMKAHDKTRRARMHKK